MANKPDYRTDPILDFKRIPKLPDSLEDYYPPGTPRGTILAAPKNIPTALGDARLFQLYGFTQSDFDYKWPKLGGSTTDTENPGGGGGGGGDGGDDTDEVPPVECLNTSEAAACKPEETDDPGNSGGDNQEPPEEDTSGRICRAGSKYNRWYSTVFGLQNGREWIFETALTSTLEEGKSAMTRMLAMLRADTGHNSGLLEGREPHPPADVLQTPQPPMPSPTFAPASGGGARTKLKLDDSVSEVLDYSNGKLKANPPTSVEGDSNPHLVYDLEAKEMRWEDGSGQGCCPVLLYDGRLVTGLDTNGDLILGDRVATMAYPLYDRYDYIVMDD